MTTKVLVRPTNTTKKKDEEKKKLYSSPNEAIHNMHPLSSFKHFDKKR
jgi:hypothetical protein